MGRRRASNPLNLPVNVYARHGAFYYAHRDGRWERLGTDVALAKARANEIGRNLGDDYGKVPYWLGEWLGSCRVRVEAKKLAPRTYEDYADAVEKLKVWFKDFYPTGIDPTHVGEYLDKGVELDRAVRANREKAALSVFFTWMMRAQAARPAGVKSNPCTGVRKNTETKRERYVEANEMSEPLAKASVAVWGLAHLVYRTLQRPEDVITWTARNIMVRRDPVTGRDVDILRVVQGKSRRTGPPKVVDIEITAEIDAILKRLKVPRTRKNSKKPPSKVITGLTILNRLDGKPYTYDGLCGMLKKAQDEVRELHAIKRGPLDEMPSWGFYDMKGKGATDMWLSGVPLTVIQVLCGHDSIKTTERYVKARWKGIVTPNQVAGAV